MRARREEWGYMDVWSDPSNTQAGSVNLLVIQNFNTTFVHRWSLFALAIMRAGALKLCIWYRSARSQKSTAKTAERSRIEQRLYKYSRQVDKRRGKIKEQTIFPPYTPTNAVELECVGEERREEKSSCGLCLLLRHNEQRKKVQRQ